MQNAAHAAVGNLAGASASRIYVNKPLINLQPHVDPRAEALRNVLMRYGSPIAQHADIFVKYADIYNIDWKLLPAISGVESTFGKAMIRDTYNAYGWGGGTIYFRNWENGIETINRALRKRYMKNGDKTVWEIAPIYAESKTWAPRVNYFMNIFNKEYLRLTTKSLSFNL